MNIIMSFIGIAVLLLLAILLSTDRKKINLRTVGGAFAIQFFFGAFILYVPLGRDFLYGISSAVSNIIGYGNSGIEFLFGNLVNFSVDGLGFIFAFKVLPVIIFFSSLISVLYYLKIMPIVINFIGGGLQKALGTSRAESLSATANIFVGLTEAPLVVKPFIPNMTQSELFAVMCGGLASVAGGVLVGYASMGVPMEYLIAASFMAAPGGLLFAKIIKPEVDEVEDQSPNIEADAGDKPANVIDAAASGASSGLQLALNIGAMLIAFIGLIALLNGILGGIGGYIDMPHLSLQYLLGLIFAPLAFLIGVPWEEATLAGSFIGQKVIVNEFVAYLDFAKYLASPEELQVMGLMVLSEKTKAIVSFALCGFANLGSIAMLLGGLGYLAPTRRHQIAKLGMRAIAAGTLSNLMSATIAGLFISF
ncbi:NupC/NupG family nucleoside CNT transporter [Vibrio sp. S12_S33]|uniref:NupC/NupG family nucleoside CNT transporter n=1 Tax=Vibrio sp. S12_S33 TaxID=2720223 RepID=UPI00177B9AE0|nr:NupC/NupG family nucleoside CNT transporter [Vibrio sp. S12_S33]MBD1565132.1 NupC/NupG family nucleoside CNT transporter [Vibrio sp. S12_S33]